jgi:polysaccharide biosynthesis protein PslJ
MVDLPLAVDRRSIGRPLACGVAVLLLAACAVGGGSVAKLALPAAAIALLTAVSSAALLAWKNLLALLIAVILFIPIRRYTLPGSLPFQLEPYRLLVAVVAAGWLTSLLVDPRVRLRRTGFEGPLAAIAMVSVLSVLVNSGRVASLNVGSDVGKKLSFFASFFVVTYLIVAVVRTYVDLDFLVRVIVGGGSIVAAFALIESRTHFNVFDHLAGAMPFLKRNDFSLTAQELDRGARLRVYASSQHPIALGALFVMLLPLSVYLAHKYGRRRWQLAAVLLLFGAVATVSRTSIVMLLVVGLVYLRLRPHAVRRLWPLLLPGLLAMHIALPGTIGTLKDAFFPQGGLIAQQAAAQAGSGRIATLGPALHEYAQRPLVGEGFGTRVVDLPRQNAYVLDDQWLGTLLETGIFGVFAWIALFRKAIRACGRAAREDHGERGWLLVGLAASIAAYSVGMLTYDAFSFVQVTFMLFILLGLTAAALQLRAPSAEP